MNKFTRRGFIEVASIAGLGTFALSAKSADTPAAPAAVKPAPTPPAIPDEFPTQSPALAREMVGVSHGNIERVKELLKPHPTLANATWDWGFGDWESALGAASHVGNPEIARLLLDHGARPSIFSAAMLGQLAVVKAFVEASPGVQGIRGPHGITLLAHARAGGDSAKPVLAYLTEVGGADPVYQAVDLSPELMARYTGVYAFGARDTDRIEITVEKGGLRFKRSGTSARNLMHVGDHAFHPVGAPAVRVRFAVAADTPASELTVFDPELVLTAKRVG